MWRPPACLALRGAFCHSVSRPIIRTAESPMIGMSRSPIVTGVVLGALFMYCLHGAIVGDLAIYSRNGPDIHLHGLAAWLVTLSPVLISASLSVRGGLIEFSSASARRTTELALMIAGGALFVLFVGLQIGSH